MKTVLYTETGTCIMDRVENGRTFFFEKLFDAMEKAKELRTYPYQVFDQNNRHAGYGVPK